MSVVLQTEKRNARTRLFYVLLYLLLGIGAASMIYPFLMMVSGSFKSRIDAAEMDLVPRFFSDDELLYQKYVEAKYGEDIGLYNRVSGNSLRNFSEVSISGDRENVMEQRWRSFMETSDMPPGWFMVGFGPTLDGKIIQKNERAFRHFIKKACGGDLSVFRQRFKEPIENWFFLKFRAERLTDRNYQVSKTKLMEAFYEFKKSVPIEDRIVVSCDQAFALYLESQGESPKVLEARCSGSYWSTFVRDQLHPQYVNVDAVVKEDWINFLRERYADLDDLNRFYQHEVDAFEDIPFPPRDRIYASAELTDYMVFYADRDRVPDAVLSVDGPDLRWRSFSANNVSMQQGQVAMDESVLMSDSSAIKRQFSSRNFVMVFEYILFYGQGIRNTLIYCLLSIALALLINPLAAYALSRCVPLGTYKILLFLIATMAFPTVVTMIPNFLLLRDLGLLNTFAALLLPTMANGYSIFLLKGFFDSLPRELFEAAEIDGAGEWTKFWMLTMNLSKPILAVIALGAFTAAYSNFMYAFILCQDRGMWTLMVWLYQLQQFSSQGVVFASLLVAAIPTLLVFVLCQNVIIRGIVVPTEK